MKPTAALAVLILVAGCAKESDSSKDASDSAQAAAKSEFSAAEEATAWMINTKHTLAGLTPPEGHGLMLKLLELGVSEIRVADLRPDANDPAYIAAHRLMLKLPASEKNRNDVTSYLNEFTNGSYSGQGTDILSLDLPIKR